MNHNNSNIVIRKFQNIIKALNEAKLSKAKSILFCGFDGGRGKKLADYGAANFPVNNYGITEDLHQMTMHTIAQYLRAEDTLKITILKI